MREPRRVGSVLGAVLFASTLLLAAPADGGQRPVSLGEVTARAPGQSFKPLFRAAVKRELARIDFGKARPRESFVLSAALVRLHAARRGGGAEATCVVSATLRRARGGELHAILHGRAKAVDGARRTREAELDAMNAAVHSALRRVPDALR